jgi:pyruvate kinase
MLSEETAVGRDPAGVVTMMAKVVAEAEPLLQACPTPSRDIPENALACAAVSLANDMDASYIVAPTRTGLSALRVAAFRPRQPVLAYSRVKQTTRRLGLARGVTPIDLDLPVGNDPIGVTLTAARRDLPPGTRIVLLDINTTPGVPSLVNAITL